ncbi:aminoacyl-tRNA hydrolase [Kaarinaea lacus]
MQRIKQVILIRKDLKMRRGKEIAQGSHASMEFLVSQLRQCLIDNADLTVALNEKEKKWISEGMAKVCLQVNSELQLLDYHNKAKSHGIKSYLIRDSGRTEFKGNPTLTACAIGPDEVDQVDAITGDLNLY